MTLPGEQAVRAIVAGLLALALMGVVAWVYVSGSKRADFSNVVSQVQTLQGSSEISQETSDAAGRIIQESNHAIAEDRRIVATARAAGATAADRRRVHDRAREAFAEGQSAACGLQRADCRPAAPGPAGD